ncbi:ATP-dependent DNA ligase [Candidatus Woesearchaeota archaeon]|nr:ATP-dependent DNA ligase [Candidatus Woesearchaeota archaeon]
MKYSQLVEIYESLEATSKRLEKTYYIAKLLGETDRDMLPKIVLLLQGKIYPSWDERKIGVASRLVIKALGLAVGLEADKIESEWKKTGDLGKVAEALVGRKKQATLSSMDITVQKVFSNLRKLAELEGQGTVQKKMQLIAELLTSATPKEAKYIVRTILEELRVGVGEGSIRDAIIWDHFGDIEKIKETKEGELKGDYRKFLEKVQEAFDLTNDFGIVAQAARQGEKELENIRLEVNRPIKVMLAQKVDDVDEAFERVGKPCAIECKYDGFRMQVHGRDGKVMIFTRRLEDVTAQFPEVAEFFRKNIRAREFILDGEAVGFDPKTKKYLPFQKVSQRIRRKYDIDKLASQFPIELNIFDIVYCDGKNLLRQDFSERRKILRKILREEKWKAVLAEQLVTDSKAKAQEFYERTLKQGMEGVMFKKLDAPYKPGSRVGHMVKLKPVMESLDVVIVGAEWGEGKRATWLTSYAIAVRDEEGNLLEIGKVSTGLKELEGEDGTTFSEMTVMLKPLITAEKRKQVTVKPKIVIEVNYEEIQKSPTYSSGFALRFPRFVRLRTEEKSAEDASDINFVEDLYYGQKKSK